MLVGQIADHLDDEAGARDALSRTLGDMRAAIDARDDKRKVKQTEEGEHA